MYWLTPGRPLDGGDLDGRQLSAVALALAEAGLVLELEDVDLGALLVADDLSGDGGLGQVGGRGGHLVAIHQHDGSEGDLVADLTSKLVDNHDVADGDLLLTAAGFDDRVDHLNAHLCRFFERLSRAARL